MRLKRISRRRVDSVKIPRGILPARYVRQNLGYSWLALHENDSRARNFGRFISPECVIRCKVRRFDRIKPSIHAWLFLHVSLTQAVIALTWDAREEIGGPTCYRSATAHGAQIFWGVENSANYIAMQPHRPPLAASAMRLRCFLFHHQC